MSTEHVNEADREYGPTPPGAKYEHTDIDVAVAYKFATWLAAAMIISAAIVYGTFRLFEGQVKEADEETQRYPLAVGVARPAPMPALQNQPFKDLYLLRAEEAAKLESYGWVDKEGGIARLPIERAMEVALERGFPARQGGGDGVSMVTQDSSSGRTVAPR